MAGISISIVGSVDRGNLDDDAFAQLAPVQARNLVYQAARSPVPLHLA
jgi:hypothetical protein